MRDGDILQDWLVVVPARLHSMRLPQKPLQDLGGKPLIVRVAENLQPLCAQGANLVVATDDDQIASICQKNNLNAMMTDSKHSSGTDRCAEVAAKHPQAKYILNVQGDEPFIKPTDLLALMRATAEDTQTDIGTLAFATSSEREFGNPNVVKVVCDANNYAVYFSRAAIPHPRDGGTPNYWRHIGVYAFRREALRRFCKLAPGKLEQIEKLEQLRALENQMRIRIHPATQLTIGIDTPEDLEAARAYFKR